jgi:tetratricopeptide (TPR) repeat protein
MEFIIVSILSILVALIIVGSIIAILKKIGVIIAIILAIGGIYWGVSYIKQRSEFAELEKTQRAIELKETINKYKQDSWEKPDFEKIVDSEKQAITVFRQADKQFAKKQFQSALTNYQKSLSMVDPEQHPIIFKKIALCLKSLERPTESQIYQEKYDNTMQKIQAVIKSNQVIPINMTQENNSKSNECKFFSPRFDGWWVWIFKYILYIAGIVSIIVSIAALSDKEIGAGLVVMPIGFALLYGGFLC